VTQALLTPHVKGKADQVGKRLFRKQILPIGEIEYEGRTLSFTRDYLNDLAKSFNASAFDQVPFLLANERNEHHSDPEKYRGETVGVEVGDDGLYGLIQLSEEGAKVVEENPKLGVSARIIRGIQNGKDALQHVLGTLDPKVTGMKPWEAVSLSKHQDAEVVDLTSLQFTEAGDPESDSSSRTVSDKLSDADRDTLVTLAKKEGAKDALIDAGISDEEVKEVVEGLIASAREEETSDDKQPVAALSKEQSEAIELAEKRANEADRRVRNVEAELAEAKFQREREKLIAAGVPPADIDLAEPVLKGGSGVIELSNGTKVDAHSVVSKLLDQRKGTIDFSVIGVGAGNSEDDRDPAVKDWVEGKDGDS
jgi:hypothetical protein